MSTCSSYLVAKMTVNIKPLETIDLSSVDFSVTGAVGSGSSTNVTWSYPNTWTTTDIYTVSPSLTMQPQGKISLQGKDADIEINGESLVQMLKNIQERINILTVNAELEKEWDELRELGDQYRALEKRIIEKIQTWDRLRAQDSDNR